MLGLLLSSVFMTDKPSQDRGFFSSIPLFITNIWTKPVMPFLARRGKKIPKLPVVLFYIVAPQRPLVSAAEIATAPGPTLAQKAN